MDVHLRRNTCRAVLLSEQSKCVGAHVIIVGSVGNVAVTFVRDSAAADAGALPLVIRLLHAAETKVKGKRMRKEIRRKFEGMKLMLPMIFSCEAVSVVLTKMAVSAPLTELLSLVQ